MIAQGEGGGKGRGEKGGEDMVMVKGLWGVVTNWTI
jgi:hypothetical protein